MKDNWNTAYAFTLAQEGGFSDHPKDPGGPTMNGIIQSEYDAYRTLKGLPRQSVRRLTAAERLEIYKTSYADKVRFADLPPGIDLAVYDAAVNSGVGQSAKWLQRALGVAVDGELGPKTAAAAQAYTNQGKLLASLCSQRLDMLRGLKTWPVFGKGWARRVKDVQLAASALMHGAPQPAPAEPADADAHAGAVARAPASQTSVESALVTKEGALAVVPVLTAIISAAANPGPLAWAIAAAVLLGAVAAAYLLIQRQKAG